jgi:hypothetical protein
MQMHFTNSPTFDNPVYYAHLSLFPLLMPDFTPEDIGIMTMNRLHLFLHAEKEKRRKAGFCAVW